MNLLHLWRAVIKGGLHAVPAVTRQRTKVPTSFNGEIFLSHCSVTGGLTLRGSFAKLSGAGLLVQGDVLLESLLGVPEPARLAGTNADIDAPATIMLRSAVVMGSLTIIGRCGNSGWQSQPEAPEGTLNLAGATVHGELHVEGVFGSLCARRLTVHGNSSLRATLFYSVDLSKSDLHGDLDLSLLKFSSTNATDISSPHLLLVGCRDWTGASTGTAFHRGRGRDAIRENES